MRRCLVSGLLLFGAGLAAAGEITVQPLDEAEVWKRAEFAVADVGPVSNPFDPDVVRVDGVFRSPGGAETAVPGFWYQPYERALEGGREVLRVSGEAEWRVRFTPREVGRHELIVRVEQSGGVRESTALVFEAGASAGGTGAGYVTMDEDRRYFRTTTGQPLPLNGACVSWHGARGTYDYDAWFAGMAAAGENFARLWMAPWAFGIECAPAERLNYRLDRAWQIDYVFQLAEAHGIRLLLCLDYHGMFETEPDYWGGNNYWPQHPYRLENGGPAASQNAFFTNAAAKELYRKRLRYLIARYGYSTHLLAWQFFNEIDNVYRHLNPADVSRWHADLGGWLHANDPYGHLVSTSLTGSSDRPDIWRLPQMDFAVYHAYGMPQPVTGIGAVVSSMRTRYRKPVLIGEYGVDWRGWAQESDPHLRGFRQGLWAGALSGSTGTVMSWWWEQIHRENLYPLYGAVTQMSRETSWGKGKWEQMQFDEAGAAPSSVGGLIDGGEPFTTQLALNIGWGAMLSGQIAVASTESAGNAAAVLNSFVHGTTHSDLRIPFVIEAWFGSDARMVLHLNSVSGGAIMSVRVDGTETYRWPIPNRDSGSSVNNEYNTNVVVELPAGRRRVEIRNAGADWFYLDWVQLENVLPSEYAQGWHPLPVAVGLKGEVEALVYVVNPAVHYPSQATLAEPAILADAKLGIQNWPDGNHAVVWHEPATWRRLGMAQAAAKDGKLELELPAFREDLLARIILAPELEAMRDGQGAVQMIVRAAQGLEFAVEKSADLIDWNVVGTVQISATHEAVPLSAWIENPASFFRLSLGLW